MRRLAVIAAVLSFPALVPAPAWAQAAAGLNNKSVTVTWTESRSQRNVGAAAFRPVSIPYTMTVYVSSQGRPFMRMTVTSSTGRQTNSSEAVGSGSQQNETRARNIQLRGNTIIHTVNNGGLGRRVQITVNGSSCSASVVTAKLAGARSVTTRSVASGVQVEFESVSAGPASCSVREGNAFAS